MRIFPLLNSNVQWYCQFGLNIELRVEQNNLAVPSAIFSLAFCSSSFSVPLEYSLSFVKRKIVLFYYFFDHKNSHPAPF